MGRPAEKPAVLHGRKLKYKLYKQHIAYSAGGNGQKHLSLPEMKHRHQSNGQQFRNSVAAGKQIYIPQTVDDQQAKHRGWKELSDILNIFGRRLSRGKNQKRKKTFRTVPRITMPMVISCCVNVMVFVLLSPECFSAGKAGPG